MQTQTRQQRRAALRDDSPWKDVKVSPSPRERNRARYRAKKQAKAEAAAKAAGRIVGDIASVQ